MQRTICQVSVMTSVYIYNDFKADLLMKYQSFLRLIDVCCNVRICKYRAIDSTFMRVHFRSIMQIICLKL